MVDRDHRECEIDEDLVRLVPDMKDAGGTAAALLIECRANGAEGLQVCNAGCQLCRKLVVAAEAASTWLFILHPH